MELSPRQYQIIEIVKANEPINGDTIAQLLGLSRSTLRSDFAILTMTGILDARPKIGYFYSGLDFQPLFLDKLNHMTVAEIMIPAIIIKQDTSVQMAISHLFLHDAGSLYVVDDNEELVGLVSRKDLLRTVLNKSDVSVPIAVMMTRWPNIHVTYPNRPVLEAGQMLRDFEIDSLPVLKSDQSKQVVGKLSKTSLAYLLVDLGVVE
ncbi:helix-turn-helix transcriptional regulator [Eremococcus coleocola]|uniref:CBS domain protein n=1 Tax=Eremococcus coleocola ACS-139-V-Col8 TaxID=908337 RepID=E4KNB2_9LACT|nr:helix-turn-helix transcriptional regulator [Eremococcus coleocola]EFR31566.1 CBS domain protein [Eremococcus coleocola ACS-139-V-Col8]